MSDLLKNDLDRISAAGSLDELEAQIADVIVFARRYRQVLCMMLATAKRRFIGAEANYAGWVREHCPALTGKEPFHMLAIGEMLLDLKDEDSRLFERVFALDSRKLYQLSRLNREHGIPAVVNFLTLNRIEKMKREEVAAEVNALLGKPAGESRGGSGQMELPGFDAALEALVMTDDEQIFGMIYEERFDFTRAAEVNHAALNMARATSTWTAAHVEETDIELLEEWAAAAKEVAERFDEALRRRKAGTLGIE